MIRTLSAVVSHISSSRRYRRTLRNDDRQHAKKNRSLQQAANANAIDWKLFYTYHSIFINHRKTRAIVTDVISWLYLRACLWNKSNFYRATKSAASFCGAVEKASIIPGAVEMLSSQVDVISVANNILFPANNMSLLCCSCSRAIHG